MRYQLIFLIIILISTNLLSQTKDSTSNKWLPIIDVYGKFEYNLTNNVDKKFSFVIDRAYLGQQYNFNNKFSGKIIIEAGRPTTIDKIYIKDSTGNLIDIHYKENTGSYYTMQLKIAELIWQINDNIKLNIGSVGLNNYNTQDKFWGLKYLAETFQDRYFLLPSADLGIISFFKINKNLNFDISITNGEGNKNNQDNFGDLQFASGLDIKPIENFIIRFYYDYSKSKDSLKPAERQLFSLFAGYEIANTVKIGGEYNYRKNNLYINNNNLHGFSFYGIYKFYKNLSFFARFDKLYVNKLYLENESWYAHYPGNGYFVGINYMPTNGINFSINYQLWQPNDNNISLQHHLFLNFQFKI